MNGVKVPDDVRRIVGLQFGTFWAHCGQHNTVWEAISPEESVKRRADAMRHCAEHGCIVEFREVIRVSGSFHPESLYERRKR